jgi:hypothetical protein
MHSQHNYASYPVTRYADRFSKHRSKHRYGINEKITV